MFDKAFGNSEVKTAFMWNIFKWSFLFFLMLCNIFHLCKFASQCTFYMWDLYLSCYCWILFLDYYFLYLFLCIYKLWNVVLFFFISVLEIFDAGMLKMFFTWVKSDFILFFSLYKSLGFYCFIPPFWGDPSLIYLGTMVLIQFMLLIMAVCASMSLRHLRQVWHIIWFLEIVYTFLNQPIYGSTCIGVGCTSFSSTCIQVEQALLVLCQLQMMQDWQTK